MTTRRLRVLIDARMLIGRFSGVARVVTRLVEELVRQDRVQVVALCGDEIYPPWTQRGDIEQVVSGFGKSDRGPRRRLSWERKNLPAMIRQSRADLYHATWNSGIPWHCPVPSVLTLHDLIGWDDRPRGLRARLDAWCHRNAVRSSVRRAKHVVTVSDFVRADALQRLGLDPGKVVAIPNAVDPASKRACVRSDRSVLLYVGGHEPRKNLQSLFAAVRRYDERLGRPIELRLTGRRETLSPAAANELGRLPRAVNVRFLGDIDDAELSCQYATADALLLLSESEGFGIPVLEAMAHGCPVIAARRSALPEVVGDAGILVEPCDSDAVAVAIHNLLYSKSLRAEVIAKGFHRASTFTWSDVASTYANIYAEVLSVARPKVGGSRGTTARAWRGRRRLSATSPTFESRPEPACRV